MRVVPANTPRASGDFWTAGIVGHRAHFPHLLVANMKRTLGVKILMYNTRSRVQTNSVKIQESSRLRNLRNLSLYSGASSFCCLPKGNSNRILARKGYRRGVSFGCVAVIRRKVVNRSRNTTTTTITSAQEVVAPHAV